MDWKKGLSRPLITAATLTGPLLAVEPAAPPLEQAASKRAAPAVTAAPTVTLRDVVRTVMALVPLCLAERGLPPSSCRASSRFLLGVKQKDFSFCPTLPTATVL